MTENLLEVKHLCKYFPAGKNLVLKAVDGVSFTIKSGETLGLVGESGCGKTTCGRTLLKLYSKTSGEIYFRGKEISKIRGNELLAFRKSAQMIFQDPYYSVDPRMTIGEIVAEGMNVHMNLSNGEKNDKINELLLKVNLTSDYAGRFPHELSGGQLQRIGIARALAIDSKFIVCDEPISALDVSIQAQIVNLLMKLQRENDLTYLFITHDLSMVRHISDRIGIMYLGSLVETGSTEKIFANALHPYTKALISAIPEADPHSKRMSRRIRLEGEVPSPIDSPSGCKFRTRCAYAKARCAEEAPELCEAEEGHFVACHFWNNI